MEKKLTKLMKASSRSLRDEAWALLAIRRHLSNRRLRDELTVRAFALVQLAAQLD